METVVPLELTAEERRRGMVSAVAWLADGPHGMTCITVVLFSLDAVFYGSFATGLNQKIPVIDMIVNARRTALKGDRRVSKARIERLREATLHG